MHMGGQLELMSGDCLITDVRCDVAEGSYLSVLGTRPSLGSKSGDSILRKGCNPKG